MCCIVGFITLRGGPPPPRRSIGTNTRLPIAARGSAGAGDRTERASDGEEAQQPDGEPAEHGEWVVWNGDAVDGCAGGDDDGGAGDRQGGADDEVAGDDGRGVEPGGAVSAEHAELAVRGDVHRDGDQSERGEDDTDVADDVVGVGGDIAEVGIDVVTEHAGKDEHGHEWEGQRADDHRWLAHHQTQVGDRESGHGADPSSAV